MQYDFEQNVKHALEVECQDVTASRNLKERIDEAILDSQKEAGTMKHLSVKKLVIGVAAACLLVGGGAYAAGHATGLVSGTSLSDTYKSYDDIDKAQGKLGYEVDSIETFSNGYDFREMSVDDVDGVDDEGNKVYTYKEMTIHYEKDGENTLWLNSCKPVEEAVKDKTPDATAQCGDITLYYDEYTYKFVPVDYELTEEDKENEARDDYFISYGSDEVEIMQNKGVTWEKEGTYYSLSGFDLSMSSDEMFAMANEVIERE